MSKKIALFSIYLSLSFIFSYLEALLPISIGVPGIKLGLSNILILIALYQFNLRSTIFLSIIKNVLVSITFGSLSMLLYSLSGGFLSILAMWIGKKLSFSIIGVSVLGAVFHNIGQLLVALLVIQTLQLVYYFSVLLITGVIAGILIGYLSKECLRRIKI